MSRRFPGLEADLGAGIARDDQRRRENAAARARCMADVELVAILEAQARRRGEPGINWPEYFRALDINYP